MRALSFDRQHNCLKQVSFLLECSQSNVRKLLLLSCAAVDKEMQDGLTLNGQ